MALMGNVVIRGVPSQPGRAGSVAVTVAYRARRFMLLSFLCSMASTASAAPRFGPDRIVNDDAPGSAWRSSESSGQHNLVAVGDSAYFIWGDARPGASGVYFARSVNRGLSFGPNQLISDNEHAGLPAIAVRSTGEIDVAWQDHRDHELNGRIYVDRSRDGGRTWGTDHAISTVFPPGTKQRDPAIAVDPITGTIYVAWLDTRYGDVGAIVCARSVDGGASFETPVLLTTGWGYPPRKPTMGIGPAGQVYVAWYEHTGGDTVRFTVSLDYGLSFMPSVRAMFGHQPSLVVAPSGHILIASVLSVAGGSHRIRVARSVDGGASFGPPVQVAETTVTTPSLAVANNGQVFVAWTREGSPWEVRCGQSMDGGATFSAGEVVNDVNAPLFGPAITALPTGRPLIAWTDQRWDFFTSDLFVDGGSSFSTRPDILLVGAASGSVSEPLVAMPNPFRGAVSFLVAFSDLPTGRAARLDVFDPNGRLVREIGAFSIEASGEYIARWDGADRYGRLASSGVYYVTLAIEGERWTKRIVYLR